MTTTRRVKTDRERAQEELDVYAGRLKRALTAREDASRQAEEADAEYERLHAIYQHLLQHPAFGDDRPDPLSWVNAPDDDEVSLGDPSASALAPHPFRAADDVGDPLCDLDGCARPVDAAVHEPAQP